MGAVSVEWEGFALKFVAGYKAAIEIGGKPAEYAR
jgi:hypothetical protein